MYVYIYTYIYIYSFPGDSAVKNLPAIQDTQEMQIWSLGQQDPLEEEMAAWRIP